MARKNKYKLCFDVMELHGLNDKESYDKGFGTGLTLDYRTERTVEKARSEVVAFGLLAHEQWEKTGDYKFVLLHEYIRGLNHGLQQRVERIRHQQSS